MVATASAQMKFASEARLSQGFPLAMQGRLVCHYLDTLWTLGSGPVHQTERYQLSLTYNASWGQEVVPSTDLHTTFTQY